MNIPTNAEIVGRFLGGMAECHLPIEVIRLTVMMYVRYPFSLRQVEDLLPERDIYICHETVRF